MDAGEPETAPFLRIVRGDPRADEVAALVAVLSAASGARTAGVPMQILAWAARPTLMRRQLPPGRGGWLASAHNR